jgi:predicted transposase YdaD
MESEPGARRVLDAMASTEVREADRLRMTAIILRLASDAARQILEAMMTTSEYEKTFIERIHDQGIAEGEARGKAESKAEDVLKLLNARHLAPTPEQRQQVTSCTDAAQLDVWFDRAITAGTAAEVFAD